MTINKNIPHSRVFDGSGGCKGERETFFKKSPSPPCVIHKLSFLIYEHFLHSLEVAVAIEVIGLEIACFGPLVP